MKSFIFALAVFACCATAQATNYVRIPVPGISGLPGSHQPGTPNGGENSSGLILSSTSLAFDDTLNKTSSLPKFLTVKNTGTADAPLVVDLSGEYKEAPGKTCGALLAPGAQCEIGVVFSPAAPGRDIAGKLTVQSPAGEATVNLTGSSYLADSSVIVVKSGSVKAKSGGVTVVGANNNTTSLSVEIVGTAPVTFSPPSISGPNAAEFSAYVGAAGGGVKCSGVVAPGTSCLVRVSFTAKEVGTSQHQAVLNLPNNGTDRYGQAGPQSNIMVFEDPIVESGGILYDSGTAESPKTMPLTGSYVSLINAGNRDVHVSSITVVKVSESAGDLLVTPVTSSCDTLVPNYNCQLSLSPSTPLVGVHDFIITINSDAITGSAKWYVRLMANG